MNGAGYPAITSTCLLYGSQLSTLDMTWEKGRKQGSNPSLTDAIYEDFKVRGIEVDETSWVAYQVTTYVS